MATLRRLCIVFGCAGFPINRRHQGLATGSRKHSQECLGGFPINRRHQELATKGETAYVFGSEEKGFQSIGVTKDWRPPINDDGTEGFPMFPINKLHQGLATTIHMSAKAVLALKSFQSIGVTKVWRRVGAPVLVARAESGFQSIGVTKDWRQRYLLPSIKGGVRPVSNQ